MFFDLKTVEVTEGYHDIVVPLIKLEESSQILFQQVDLLLDNWEGDFLYDITSGIPYEKIQDKKFVLERIENLYYTKLSRLKYFKDISDFNVQLSKQRELRISFCVTATSNTKRIYNTVVLVDGNGNVLNDSSQRILQP